MAHDVELLVDAKTVLGQGPISKPTTKYAHLARWLPIAKQAYQVHNFVIGGLRGGFLNISNLCISSNTCMSRQ